jgi:hypothetical protein
MTQTKLQSDDSVIVKAHIEDPDLNINIGGWQGRILEINEEDLYGYWYRFVVNAGSMSFRCVI